MARKKADETKFGVWNIRIRQYGLFEFLGTKAEARERMDEKADWEGTTGSFSFFRDATPEETAWYAEHGFSDVDHMEIIPCSQPSCTNKMASNQVHEQPPICPDCYWKLHPEEA